MTENEAIELLKNNYPKTRKMVDGRLQGGFDDHECDVGIVIDLAIKALEEIQQYRAIEKELKERYHANVDIPLLMHHFIETVFEGEKHEGFCLLTNEDAKAWDEYKSIGTPEECRAAVEKQMARKPLIGTNMMTKKKYKVCPKCGNNLINTDYLYFYCDMCGQKLDWRAKNEVN